MREILIWWPIVISVKWWRTTKICLRVAAGGISRLLLPASNSKFCLSSPCTLHLGFGWDWYRSYNRNSKKREQRNKKREAKNNLEKTWKLSENDMCHTWWKRHRTGHTYWKMDSVAYWTHSQYTSQLNSQIFHNYTVKFISSTTYWWIVAKLYEN